MSIFLVAQLSMGVVAAIWFARLLTLGRIFWSGSSLFIFIVAWLLNASAMSKITGQISTLRTLDAIQGLDTREDVIYGASLSAVTLAPRLVILVCLVVIFHNIVNRTPESRPAVNLTPLLALLSLALISSVSNNVMGDRFFTPHLLALSVLAVTAATMKVDRGVWTGVAAFGISLSVTSAVALLLHPQLAVDECGRKCGALGQVYSGALLNENKLGMALALCIPAVVYVFSKHARFFMVSYVVLVIVSTGSRSAVVATALIMVAISIRPAARLLAGGHGGDKVARVLGIGLLLIVLTTGIVIPWFNRDPDAFTGRGRLWAVAGLRNAGHEILGRGWGDWIRASDAGYFQGGLYGPHNQYLHIYNVAGLVGVFLFAIFILSLVWRNRVFFAQAMPVLTAIFACGILEIPMSMSRLEWTSWLYPFLIMAARLGAAYAPKSDSISTAQNFATEPDVGAAQQQAFRPAYIPTRKRKQLRTIGS